MCCCAMQSCTLLVALNWHWTASQFDFSMNWTWKRPWRSGSFGKFGDFLCEILRNPMLVGYGGLRSWTNPKNHCRSTKHDMFVCGQLRNILQATLRQVSSKLSDCLLVIGACCLASVVILAEHVLFALDVDADMVVDFLPCFFPLILVFLYCILRAAEVTEKANRVAPLVNSWQFQNADTEAVWMDDARQFAVQYINQSRPGFYVRGALLTVPNAQKISYYFAAISFASLSRLVR